MNAIKCTFCQSKTNRNKKNAKTPKISHYGNSFKINLKIVETEVTMDIPLIDIHRYPSHRYPSRTYI